MSAIRSLSGVNRTWAEGAVRVVLTQTGHDGVSPKLENAPAPVGEGWNRKLLGELSLYAGWLAIL